MRTPEGAIKTAICQYLSFQKGVFFWINSSTGIYDPGKGIFRKNKSKFQKTGTSDILGIVNGRPLAIEVKAPRGQLTIDQRIFIEDFKRAGGVAFMAKSVDDVIRELAPYLRSPEIKPSCALFTKP